MKQFGQPFDQVPKIDSLLGNIIKNQSFATDHLFGIDQLHLHVPFANQVEATRERLLLKQHGPVPFGFIFRCRNPDNPSVRFRRTEIGSRLFGCRAEDGPPFMPAFTANNHKRTTGECAESTSGKFAENARDPVAHNV